MTQKGTGADMMLVFDSASFISKRFGYKKTIIFGLGLYVIGALCFYPSATNLSYGGFVGSLFVIACGLATLENCKLSLDYMDL